MIDLLQEHTDIDSADVDCELRLLDACYYLAYNCMLDEMPIGQIREDYEQGTLIKQCISVHGIKKYPKDYNKILGLQEALDGQKHIVAIEVLRLLDADKKLDDLEGNNCLFVVDLIKEHLINDNNADYSDELEAWLQKIVF